MVMSLFAIGVALAGFTAVGLGQMMWQKREIQLIADAAARTAASQLGDAPGFTTARQLAANNGLRSTDTLSFECLTGASNAVTTCGSSPEAARAIVTRELKPFFFASATTLRAQASAEPSPIVTASITSTVATLDTTQSALLNSILSTVGGGNINLFVAGGSSGLISNNLNVDLLRLSNQLGVSSLQELLGLQLGLGTLLDAGNQTLNAPLLDISLKNALDRIRLPVGNLLTLDLTQADAALASVNLGDLAITGLLGSVQGNAIRLNLSNLPAGLSVKLIVTEAPKILIARKKRGVSPVGFVRSGQVKLEFNFEKSVSDLLKPLTGIGFSNISLLKGGLYVQAGGAQVTVNDLVCKMPRTLSETRFTAQNSLLKLCLSQQPANFADTSATPISCGAPAEVLTLNSNLSLTSGIALLGGLLSQAVNIKVLASANLNGDTRSTSGILYGKNPEPPFRIPSATGDALSSLVSNLNLNLQVKTSLLGGILSLDPLLQPLLNTVISTVQNVVRTALAPILQAVGGIADSVLRIPGIALNDGFFDVSRLDCSASRLIQ
jgi:uncharacterized membrane protein